MRVTEFIDFLNRKELPDKFEYSHLEIREKTEKDGKKKTILKKIYKDVKKRYKGNIT